MDCKKLRSLSIRFRHVPRAKYQGASVVGSPRTAAIHHQWAARKQHQVALLCVISCPGHRLDTVGLCYRRFQVPGARRRWPVSATGPPPHPAIFHVAFLGQLPLALS